MLRVRNRALVVSTVGGLTAGVVLGAIGATGVLLGSVGSPGDLQVRHLEQLRALIAHENHVVSAELSHSRTVHELASWMIVAASSFHSVSSDSDRQSLIHASRWVVSSNVFGSDEGNKSLEWAAAAAKCVVDHARQPEQGAACAQQAKPDGFAGTTVSLAPEPFQ